jgi:2-isopropylmalate synthase
MSSESDGTGPWELVELHSSAGTGAIASAALRLKHADGRIVDQAAVGGGPIDASFTALDRATGIVMELRNFEVRSVTMGEDAQGEVTVTVEHDSKSYRGRGVSTDIVEAGALAYLDVINRICRRSAAAGHEPARSTSHAASI